MSTLLEVLKLFNPVYIQISKFFAGLTDRQIDRLTDKTDCLTPSRMRAWGKYKHINVFRFKTSPLLVE